MLQIRALVLGTAMDWIADNQASPAPILGFPFTDHGLRLGVEASLRSLARVASSQAHRYALIDLANEGAPDDDVLRTARSHPGRGGPHGQRTTPNAARAIASSSSVGITGTVVGDVRRDPPRPTVGTPVELLVDLDAEPAQAGQRIPADPGVVLAHTRGERDDITVPQQGR